MTNQNEPVRTVRFFALEPFDPHGEGNHKVFCPVCEDGLLLMHRDYRTGELSDRDVCTLCGQRFVYEDIAVVRQLGP